MDENNLKQLIELNAEYDTITKQLGALKVKLSMVKNALKGVCYDIVEQMVERGLKHIKVVSGGEEYVVFLSGGEFPLSVVPIEGTVFLDSVSDPSTQS